LDKSIDTFLFAEELLDKRYSFELQRTCATFTHDRPRNFREAFAALNLPNENDARSDSLTFA